MTKNFYKSFSTQYKNKGRKYLSKEEVEAYVHARMPATLAANRVVMESFSQRIKEKINTFLDLGAGAGAGFLAAKEFFPSIEKAILVDRNEEMIKQGKNWIEAIWVKSTIQDFSTDKVDLALFSYSLRELSEAIQNQMLKKIWEKSEFLVLVEPGTPRGYEVILRARAFLISLGGYVLAPCPHQKQCPLKERDWCHFSVRLERSKEHKNLKEAVLGWEDEKYSYVIFGKKSESNFGSRILRPPKKSLGYIDLHLCTQNGLQEVRIRKKEKELYKRVRKSKWGDAIDPSSPVGGQGTSLQGLTPHC